MARTRRDRNNIKTETAAVIMPKQKINSKFQIEIINGKYNKSNPPI